eukprot:c13359_g1_i1 orf=39-224(+)
MPMLLYVDSSLATSGVKVFSLAFMPTFLTVRTHSLFYVKASNPLNKSCFYKEKTPHVLCPM